MALPMNIVKFANNNADVLKTYDMARDYYFHYMSSRGKKLGDFDASVPLDKKEEKMHKALLAEITRISGQPMAEGLSIQAWSMNPVVKWATFATVGMMIDAIIPDSLVKNIGVYTEVHQIGFGDTLDIDIAPNSLFTVSESSNAQRKGFNKKDFKHTVTLSAVNHAITVETALYKVLAGRESLAEFMRKAVYSMEREMTANAYDALNTLVDNASFPAPLTVSGYATDALLHLCEVVTAYNHGAKATILGTTEALYKVLPDSAKGYRINTDSENMGIQIIRNFFDYDIMVMPQVATGSNYGLKMKNDRVYVMSTDVDKVIKMVIEGQTLTNVDEFYDNADLTQHATLNKRWGVASVTNATMGVLKF
jgi:hypothetical protein